MSFISNLNPQEIRTFLHNLPLLVKGCLVEAGIMGSSNTQLRLTTIKLKKTGDEQDATKLSRRIKETEGKIENRGGQGDKYKKAMEEAKATLDIYQKNKKDFTQKTSVEKTVTTETATATNERLKTQQPVVPSQTATAGEGSTVAEEPVTTVTNGNNKKSMEDVVNTTESFLRSISNKHDRVSKIYYRACLDETSPHAKNLLIEAYKRMQSIYGQMKTAQDFMQEMKNTNEDFQQAIKNGNNAIELRNTLLECGKKIKNDIKKLLVSVKDDQKKFNNIMKRAKEQTATTKTTNENLVANDGKLEELMENIKTARGYLVLIEANKDIAVKISKEHKETTTFAATISTKREQAQNLMKEIENAQKNFNRAKNDEQKNKIVQEVAEKKGEIAGLLKLIRTDMINLQGMLK